jgi:hypothetical protein
LNKIRRVEQNAFLKEALRDTFSQLHDATERKYDILEKRVQKQLPLKYELFTVYSTVLPLRQSDIGHTYLSPVIPEDAYVKGINSKDLIEALNKNEHPVIETVFCEADYLRCRQLDLDRQVLTGEFVIDGARYPFKCRLQRAKRYSDQVQSLYTAFLRNNIPWTTINSTYLNKFYDVCVIEPACIPLGVLIMPDQIKISFGQYEDIVRRRLLPVWNIDKYPVFSDEFPVPVLDAIHYEYRFELTKLGADCGYLVDHDNIYILDSRREENNLVITSSENKDLRWNLFRLRRRQDSAMDIYPYPVMTNARNDSSSARLPSGNSKPVVNKEDLKNLLSSFVVSDYVSLSDFFFTGREVKGETYNMNPFISSETLDPAFSKNLALAFEAKNRELFINRDIISFLVSALQLRYPEFRCAGVLT